MELLGKSVQCIEIAKSYDLILPGNLSYCTLPIASLLKESVYYLIPTNCTHPPPPPPPPFDSYLFTKDTIS